MDDDRSTLDLARRLADLEVRIRALEASLREAQVERELIVDELLTQRREPARPDRSEAPVHVPSNRARSPETSQRAAFVEQFLRRQTSATFTEVLEELRREYGSGITANHAIAVLKRPQFARESRGRYTLRDIV